MATATILVLTKLLSATQGESLILMHVTKAFNTERKEVVGSLAEEETAEEVFDLCFLSN